MEVKDHEEAPETLVPPGPLQKCLREAGLPPTVKALEMLEQVAYKVRVKKYGPLTIADFRRAARKVRAARENPRRVSPAGEATEMTKARAEKVLRTGHNLTSGRQWKKWKKAQRRLMNPQPQEPHGP